MLRRVGRSISQTPPRVLVSVIAAAQALAPVLVELNKTHATNPNWPGHARFHLVWQVGSHVLYSSLILTLLWWSNPCPPERFYFAVALIGGPLLAFLVALASRRLYGGTLHDPNGVLPFILQLGERKVVLEMNFILVVIGVVLLLSAVYSFSGPWLVQH